MEEDESFDGERWLPVVGYGHLYSVSDFGRVRRDAAGQGARSGTILKAYRRKNHYVSVVLSRDGFQKTHLVHRLVAASFIGPCPEGCEVAHADGNKWNNRLCNLRYARHQENILDGYAYGGRVGPQKIPLECREEVLLRIKYGDSLSAIARDFGVTVAAIWAIKHGRTWKYEKARSPSTNKVVIEKEFTDNG